MNSFKDELDELMKKFVDTHKEGMHRVEKVQAHFLLSDSQNNETNNQVRNITDIVTYTNNTITIDVKN